MLTTIWYSSGILGSICLSDSQLKPLSPHLSFSSVTPSSEACTANSQLQAVHREVVGPHHAGRPDPERDWSRPLPADCQEHQREVTHNITLWKHMMEIFTVCQGTNRTQWLKKTAVSNNKFNYFDSNPQLCWQDYLNIPAQNQEVNCVFYSIFVGELYPSLFFKIFFVSKW